MAIIALNVAAFLAMVPLAAFPERLEAIYKLFGLNPAHPVWTAFITYAFLHAGWLHLLGNMLVFWIFGSSVEDRFGKIGFLFFYLSACAFSGGAHALLERAPVIGASGGVAAVTGAYLVLFPMARVRVLFLLGLMGVFEVPSWWFIGIAFFLDAYFLTTGGERDIALIAHLAGYAMGFGIAISLLSSGLLSRETYDLFALIQRMNRRRQFRSQVESFKTEVASKQTPVRDLSLPKEVADLADTRAQISALVANEQLEAAAEKYEALQARFPDVGRAGVLSTKAQLVIANQLLVMGRNEAALKAYEGFTEAYPQDIQVPRVRVMAAVIAMRRLNDPKRARAALAGIRDPLKEPAQHELAAALAEEIKQAEQTKLSQGASIIPAQ